MLKSDWLRDWSRGTAEGIDTTKIRSSKGATPRKIIVEEVRRVFMDIL